MEKWRSIAALTALTLFLAGCNTIEGMGKDVEAAGEEVSEEAQQEQAD